MTRLLCSADGHVVEPAQLWLERLPERFRSMAPRLEYFDRFVTWWTSQGEELVTVEAFRRPDGSVVNEDVEAQVRDFDAEGIWAATLYPNLGLNAYNTPQPEVALAMAQVYNDYVREAYAPYADRMIPIAVIPVFDIDDAVAEIERSAANGFRGVALPMVAPRPYYLPEYNRIWAAAEAHGLPVSFHVGSGVELDENGNPRDLRGGVGDLAAYREPDPQTRSGMRSLWGVDIALDAQHNIAAIVGAGVLERHPALHVVAVEVHAHWLATLMAALDKVWMLGKGQPTENLLGKYDRSRPPDDQPMMINMFSFNGNWPYPLQPSEYVKRQVHATFMDDPAAIALREFTGVECLLWGSDYRHPEGSWPRSREALDEMFVGVSDADRAAITGGTLARLYGIQVPDRQLV